VDIEGIRWDQGVAIESSASQGSFHWLSIMDEAALIVCILIQITINAPKATAFIATYRLIKRIE